MSSRNNRERLRKLGSPRIGESVSCGNTKSDLKRMICDVKDYATEACERAASEQQKQCRESTENSNVYSERVFVELLITVEDLNDNKRVLRNNEPYWRVSVVLRSRLRDSNVRLCAQARHVRM